MVYIVVWLLVFNTVLMLLDSILFIFEVGTLVRLAQIVEEASERLKKLKAANPRTPIDRIVTGVKIFFTLWYRVLHAWIVHKKSMTQIILHEIQETE